MAPLVSQVAAALFPLAARHGERRLLMLKGYFDESISPQREDVSRLFVLGGYMSDLNRWDRFEADWKPMLDEAGIKEFHMADFENDEGEFKGWKVNHPDKRLALIKRVIELI